VRIGEELKRDNKIQSFTLTTLSSTPDLKLNTRGWEPIDFNWIFRG